MQFLASRSSVCKRQCAELQIDLMDVKILVEHIGDGYKSSKCTVFLVIQSFVMYYRYYGAFGSSLIIESTDSMICHSYTCTIVQRVCHFSAFIYPIFGVVRGLLEVIGTHTIKQLELLDTQFEHAQQWLQQQVGSIGVVNNSNAQRL